MKIRDLNQYIENLLDGKNTFKELGTNKELLLQKIYGQDTSQDQVKAVISDAASFASNSEEQLFYEFVQNAYDAGADCLYFYANEHYLIVLNNGEPFYTDFNIFDGNEVRDGQLYNFLAKGKSLKRNDDQKLGKYGQGSKLLYTLLTKVSENEENERLLVDALYNRKKGPYLISWYDQRQLSNLLLKQPEWTPAQGDDYKENILFAKILMSYYPVAPGVDEEWFSTQEALSAIEAFDTLVDPRRNLHFLNRGTALIIPLGDGQYERITAEENLKKVRTRLGGFASITKNQEWNKGKSLDHIIVMGEEVEQYEVKSVYVNFDIEGNKFRYHFAFNPIFAEKNFVNFFKGLPIVETKFRLGFIIDSQKFEVDNSRQRINDAHKTECQLTKAFTELDANLKELQKSDSEKFEYIYRAIAASRIPEGDDFKFIRTAFNEVFVQFFESNTLTVSGLYVNRENVRTYENASLIPLDVLGISTYQWADKDILPHLKRHGIKISEISLANILADADQNKLQKWLLSLSSTDYELFQSLVDKCKGNNEIRMYKVFKTNIGKLYSLEELQSDMNVYYPIENNMPFGECEHVVTPLADVEIAPYLNNLFNKIKTNIFQFRKTDSTKDDAANLLAWIQNKDASYLSRIRNEISLLPNRYDMHWTLYNTLESRPNNTILFDNYVVKGHIPNVVLERHWLMSPSKSPLPFWDWITRHWQDLQDKEEWGENTHKYLADIKAVNESVIRQNGLHLTLRLNLDNSGRPVEGVRSMVNNASRLTEDEYNYFSDNLQKHNLPALQPFEYYKELCEEPFRTEPISSLRIVGDGITVNKEFLKLIVIVTDDYLNLFFTQEGSGKYRITKRLSGFNYENAVPSDLQKTLESVSFCHIPNYIQELLPEESNKHKFESNPNELILAIQRTKSIKLLPFVKLSDSRVKDVFFSNLVEININSKISNEDMEWQVIEFAVRSSYNNNYIERVFEKIRFNNGAGLPESIIQKDININSNQYCVYDLNEEFKYKNLLIESFFNWLPSETEVEFFKDNYYRDRKEEVSIEELYNNLHDKSLTIEQLRFCLDYSIVFDKSDVELKIGDDENIIDALEMILRNQFNGFDKYFKMPDVDYDVKVYAPREILTKEECLPAKVSKWIDENPAILGLTTRLKTVQRCPYVGVRNQILENKSLEEAINCALAANDPHIDYTLKWAIEKNFIYAYDSERYNCMMGILENLPANYDNMAFLRYTGDVVDVNGEPKPTFRLERYNENCSFLSTFTWRNQFEKRLEHSTKLSKFIKDKVVYVYGEKELLFRQNCKKKPVWDIQIAVDVEALPEYHDKIYDKWKDMPESKGITIHLSDKPIAIQFYITSANDKVFADMVNDNDFGYVPGKSIVIQKKGKEKVTVSVMTDMIQQHLSEVEFFKEPFIALQSLYVKQYDILQEEKESKGTEKGEGDSGLILSNSSLTKEQAQVALDKMSRKTSENIELFNDLVQKLNKESLNRLLESANVLDELLGKLNNQELEILVENKDRIMQAIEDMSEAEEEEKESKVRKTIGFIGELIYSHYLESLHKEYVHAALEGVGEYDFEIKSDNTFVDVKTTLYSLKDGTAPFYLHRSQNSYMQMHPNSNYHIVRISLLDLNLQKSYEELRNLYGKDANPMENKHLRKDCEKVAKKYWQGAKIEEFDALAPEYSIHIEKKK